jgi:hypothetical protein
VELGGVYDVSQVVINWEDSFASEYEIQLKADATAAWTTVATVTLLASGIETSDIGGGKAARFVRMYGQKRGTTYGYSIYEMQVLGTPRTAAPTNVGDTNLPTGAPTATPTEVSLGLVA